MKEQGVRDEPRRASAAERIAYVAFHRESGEQQPRRSSIRKKRLRIHLAQGKSFVVEVDLGVGVEPAGVLRHGSARELSVSRDFLLRARDQRQGDRRAPWRHARRNRPRHVGRHRARSRRAKTAGRATVGQILIQQKLRGRGSGDPGAGHAAAQARADRRAPHPGRPDYPRGASRRRCYSRRRYSSRRPAGASGSARSWSICRS